jgi:hypothetical protein
LTQPPSPPAFPPAGAYSHRFYVYFLEPAAERRFLEAALRALGFEVRDEAAPVGLSGLTHSPHLMGLRTDTRHAVICQSGFQGAFAIERPGPSGAVGPRSAPEVTLIEREDRVRRALLFAGYDIKARLESEGWTVDLFYFLNATSPQEGGIDLEALSKTGPRSSAPVLYHKSASTKPILRIPLAELRRNAIGTGACFIELSDVRLDELTAVLSPHEEDSVAASRALLSRLRLPQYFQPPVDELLLGVLAKSPGGLSADQLVAAPAISSVLKHPPSAALHMPGVDYRDPMAVIKALESEKRLKVKASVVLPTEQGVQVAYEFEKSAQESWVERVLKFLPFVKSFTGGL